MRERNTSAAVVWLVLFALLALMGARGGAWLWPKLFPGPEPSVGSSPAGLSEAPSPELAAEILHRTLATLGSPSDTELGGLELPQGASARDLELALRAHPDLADSQVYVTEAGDLLFRVRIFHGRTQLLQEDLRPWLPVRPVVSGSDPPELGVLVLFEAQDFEAVGEVGRWEAPVAMGFPPFEAHSVKSARQATWSSKEVVVLLEPEHDLREQLLASPDAAGVLLDQALPEGTELETWLAPLMDFDVFLLDGRVGDTTELEEASYKAAIRYVRRAGTIGSEAELVLARNLTVRRGYGLVTVDGTEDGLSAAASFIRASREDGYSLVFPTEVARLHGSDASQRR